MRNYLPLIVLAVVAFVPNAKADWISVTNEYNFGPEMSASEACQKAERRAQEKALKSVTGEKISSDDNLVCSEVKDSAECSLNRFTWSTIDGLIKGIRNKKSNVVEGISGYRKCQVSMDVNVGVGTGTSDPGFDIQVNLNRPTFRDGEIIKVSLSPSQPMYINVFQFLPYMKNDKQVVRIFPNPFDKEQFFKKKGTVPTQKGSELYDMAVEFPKGMKKSKALVDEYLMVLGTRKPISFRDAYSREEFNARILEIPRQDRRIIRRAYNVVRPEQ